MKHLTLIRHAKATRDAELHRDLDRPLSARGLADIPFIARYLKSLLTPPPDALLTSHALRARSTADLLREEAGLTHLPLHEEPRIYEAPVNTLANVLKETASSTQHLLLFGHNPGLENLANWLCGQRILSELRTGGVIMLALEITTWSEIRLGSAQLLHAFHPAEIGGGKLPHA